MTYLENEPNIRDFRHCRVRLDALRRRRDRLHTIGFYGAVSFLALIVILTLPYHPF